MARPEVPIDPKEVAELAAEGFKVVEIAEIFGVSDDTIQRRFAPELRKGRLCLRQSLRRSQIQAAKMQNSTMLVWLGKQYLGQTDKSVDEYILEAIEEAGLSKDDLLELIKNRDMVLGTDRVKRSFEEFCALADYPPPMRSRSRCTASRTSWTSRASSSVPAATARPITPS